MKITKPQLEKIIQEETESYVDSKARDLARLFLDVIKGEGAKLSNFTKHKGLLLQTMMDMFMPDHSAAVVKKAHDNLKDGTVMETVQNQPYESKLTKSQLRQMIREEIGGQKDRWWQVPMYAESGEFVELIYSSAPDMSSAQKMADTSSRAIMKKLKSNHRDNDLRLFDYAVSMFDPKTDKMAGIAPMRLDAKNPDQAKTIANALAGGRYTLDKHKGLKASNRIRNLDAPSD